jgi:hypothetical protein
MDSDGNYLVRAGLSSGSAVEFGDSVSGGSALVASSFLQLGKPPAGRYGLGSQTVLGIEASEGLLVFHWGAFCLGHSCFKRQDINF